MVTLVSPTQTIAALAQMTAQRLGIKKYDLGGAKIDEVSVQVQQGEPKQVKASQRSGITVRVWNERGQMGVTSTTDLDERGLELALGMARDASQFGVEENIPDFSPEATAPLHPLEPVPTTLAPANLLLETLIRAETALLESHPAIASVPYNGLSQRQVEHFYLNSEGANRHQADTSTTIYLYSKTDQAGRKPRSAGAFRLSHGLDTLDIEGCIQETARKTASHLDYQPIISKPYPVVFSPEAILSLISAFSNLFNAQSILDRQSLSNLDSLHQAIASPLLNLYDDALHPQNLGAPQFDGEGTPTRRVPLIEKGVLTGLLHSAGTAKRMATSPTGHANLGAKVTVGAHFYDLLPGTEADPAYDRHRGDGIVWIDDLHALHAGVKALQGSFSLPFDGWLLRNGEKISIESATVAGDIRTLLQTIEYLEPTAEFSRYGMAPHVWVAPLAITGDRDA
ncbi:TldD/PmbA family protein [Candidatus Synechococcus calcipolaris G9]|uniref:TldD/PmbA family protein n=1 Tax=Candidatus Synechococcus calcipolaris G9 TaxID=1497997 RepID=A0ABT6EZ80_9SYNE|nr:TldD/PmbA family protein [Candidatus Synechococcus calcipolaris]MDG2990895.1 TldD/PmbA family protein [Candidatus Synechococcus calcipolaris G9]